MSLQIANGVATAKDSKAIKQISIGVFRKNVLKTLQTKGVKNALRVTYRDTNRANLMAATIGLKENVGRLIQGMHRPLLGYQTQSTDVERARTVLGDIGANLVILGRLLKIKTPTSTKKAHMAGTRAEYILKMDSYSTELLQLANESLFRSPRMNTVTKPVTIPKTGQKIEKQVEVVDTKSEKEAMEARTKKMGELTRQAVHTFWALCYDVLKEPPAVVMAEKLSRLIKENPHVHFDLEAQKKTNKKAA